MLFTLGTGVGDAFVLRGGREDEAKFPRRYGVFEEQLPMLMRNKRNKTETNLPTRSFMLLLRFAMVAC